MKINSSIIFIIILWWLGLSSLVHANQQPTISEILENLKKGNQRFISGNLDKYDYEAQKIANQHAQNPESVVLSCMDSRGIPELIFNQGIGHMFIIRVAGNIINDDILGSLEYATKIIGTKVIVVQGHTSCGAVKSACEKAKIGHITGLVRKIDPAVAQARLKNPHGSCKDPKFIDEIARLNVIHAIKEIKKKSPIIAREIKSGKDRIVGAMYDILTGKVEFIDVK